MNACIPNSDDYHDLSGDYFYRDEGAHVKQIICHLPNHGEIYSEVIGYNYDSDFIIVAQNPIYSDYRQMIGSNLRDNLKKYPNNDVADIAKSEKVADSILKHNSYYLSIFKNKINYWVISNKANKLYGPFTENEYKIKRRELDVPESLQIEYNR